VRLAVHTDQEYVRDAGAVSTGRSFVLFLGALAQTGTFEEVTVVGRLRSAQGRTHHALPRGLSFAALPEAAGGRRAGGLGAACRRWWRVLDEADVAWLVGPNVLSLPFAALALARRRHVVLGVRQDLPAYVRTRHPGRRAAAAAAVALDAAFRALARGVPAVVVGPALRARYAAAPRLLELSVSLVHEADVVPVEQALARSWDGVLRVVSVTRLEEEKNPVLLAEVLARLGPRWRMVVCGDGPLEGALRDRLAALGVADRCRIAGHVPVDGGLLALERGCHALLHVSWTEGLPQVLFEGQAAGLATVATAVGGVAAAAGETALLVPPGDADAAAGALERLAADGALRERLIRAGAASVRARSIEREAAAAAAFLAGRV
jgi:glycosyltransferase involved in cell wall biosynthesis